MRLSRAAAVVVVHPDLVDSASLTPSTTQTFRLLSCARSARRQIYTRLGEHEHCRFRLGRLHLRRDGRKKLPQVSCRAELSTGCSDIRAKLFFSVPVAMQAAAMVSRERAWRGKTVA